MRVFFNLGSKQKTIVILILVAGALFLTETFLPFKVFAPIQKIFLPVQVGIYKTKEDTLGFLGTFGDIGSLRSRNQELEEENALLLAENARLKKLKNENEILKDQLGVKEQNQKPILASVVGSDPLLSSSRILLDKGSIDQVKNGAIVFVKDILIGQIVQVGRYSSTARLLSDPDTKIPAVTKSGVKGLVQGEFGSGVIISKVAQNQKLTEGEIVFSSGEAGFPKGMVIGKIGKVDSDPAKVFQKSQITLLLDYESLEILFIAGEENE